MDVVDMGVVCILMYLKKSWLGLQISTLMLYCIYTTIEVKNKAILNINQYCMGCFVVLSN